MAASLTSAFAGMQLTSGRSALVHTRLSAPVSLPRIAPQPLTIEAAHKKGAGSTKNGRDSVSKRRGVKVYGGQPVKAGGIIIRQLGNKVHAGEGVGTGKDFTLFALQEGIVVFKANARRKTVTVVPVDQYVVPEGQRPKEGSRAQRNREFHAARRAAARAAKEAAVAAQ